MAYYLLSVANAGEGMGRIYAGNFGLVGIQRAAKQGGKQFNGISKL